ncbi:MAG: hypothetical protein IKP47_07105 [Ruminococcus sp.]|nr:hypothetical protein [Ruminococcus sp.]
MIPDFTPYLMAGEQLMWQGESHKDGPAPQASGSHSLLLFAVIWTLMSALIFGVVFMTSGSELKGGTLAATIIGAVLFIGIGVWLFIYTFHFTHEYYALTDKRFLCMSEKGVMIHQSELCRVVSAELVGIKNGCGSIVMRTDITHRRRVNGHTHTTRECWSMRGVEEPSECYRILTSVLALNYQTANPANFR